MLHKYIILELQIILWEDTFCKWNHDEEKKVGVKIILCWNLANNRKTEAQVTLTCAVGLSNLRLSNVKPMTLLLTFRL